VTKARGPACQASFYVYVKHIVIISLLKYVCVIKTDVIFIVSVVH